MKKIILSWKIITGCALLLFFSNCKVPYEPPVQSSDARYLVVEGYINGNGLTSVKLSRTRNITSGDTALRVNELNASVIIEDQNNNTYLLNEIGNGIYTGNTFLNAANRYRLHIHTSGNKEYLSDFVPYKQSPPIDNIGFNFKDDGVQVYVNTHDPQNGTRYYRWSYSETWEFHSAFYSSLKYDAVNDTVIDRTDQVYKCWQGESSTNILLGSSAKLNDDIIHEASLVFIPDHDARISVLYSILVTQYALDSSAYNYWLAMKNNTENVGSIFDPQPNQTKGNIHCISDSSEVVVGYIGTGTTTESRFFISNSSMPYDWNFASGCETKDVTPDSIAYYFLGGYTPIIEDMKGYLSSVSGCVDCTLYGTNIKPVFWP